MSRLFAESEPTVWLWSHALVVVRMLLLSSARFCVNPGLAAKADLGEFIAEPCNGSWRWETATGWDYLSPRRPWRSGTFTSRAAIIAIGTAAIGALGILSTLGAGAANAAGIPATVLRTLRAELTRPDAV